MKVLYWVNRDLRIDDNQCLKSIIPEITTLDIVLPWPRDFNDWGAQRRSFYKQAVADFDGQLQDLGQELFIFDQDWSSWLKWLQHNYHGLIFSKNFNAVDKQKEQDVLSSFKDRKPTLLWSDQGTLIAESDLPFSIDDLPQVFTSFRKKVESNGIVDRYASAPQRKLPPPTEELTLPGARAFMAKLPPTESHPQFVGGETEGLKRLKEYLWNSNNIQHYKETRNGMIRFDDSSKLSPWLALGCLSPRRVYHEIQRYQNQVVSNESTYWLIFELLWRDYFKFVAEQHGAKLFSKQGLRSKPLDEIKNVKPHQQLFEQWTQGETPHPFINANMIELKDFGWMSNRGRQNVASYLAKHLNVDWTWGAQWFAKNLLDYDPESNWGNWSYLAGVGLDPRDRKFNIDRQAQVYDPEGLYQQKFLGQGSAP